MGVYLIADLSWWLSVGNWISILKAVAGLGLVIFVHELGHFLVAKICGVKCEKFYVGFDVPIKIGPFRLPAALYKKQVGETEYGIGAIPLGGYVKMLGQDDNIKNAAAEAERIRDDNNNLDPRSYPAKSVPKRMAIISAGVVMNIIFGVIFAACAYRMGVKYLPCNIGGTVAGDSAWRLSLQPGDKIIQIGKNGYRDEALRFGRDLRFAVAMSKDELDLVIRHRDGREQSVSLQPRDSRASPFPTIGVIAATTTNVRKSADDVDRDSPFAKSDLAEDDTIIAIITPHGRVDVANEIDIRETLRRNDDVPLTFVVRRTSLKAQDNSTQDAPQTVEVVVAPQPRRTLGLIMVPREITAIQMGSPADNAGLKAGDILVQVDGHPAGDLLALDDLLEEQAGQQVPLKIRRGEQLLDLTITPRVPPSAEVIVRHDGAGPLAISTLGVAVLSTSTIASISPDAPPAVHNLRVGDTILAAEIVPAAGSQLAAADLLKRGLKPFEFSEELPNWVWFDELVQNHVIPSDVAVKLTFLRDSERQSMMVTFAESSERFVASRGIRLQPPTNIRYATTWIEAYHLGIREIKDGFTNVFFMLRTLRKNYKHIGGPLTIGIVATNEASEGLPRLLLFLTLLSANLAIINFLPIPVLDGGHMMFLMWEGVTGKPLNERAVLFLTMLGFGFVMSLMFIVIGMDIYRLFPGAG